jgi:hypothetical protein
MNASELVKGQTLTHIDGSKVRGGAMEIAEIEVMSTGTCVYGANGYLRIVPANQDRSSRFVGYDTEVKVS